MEPIHRYDPDMDKIPLHLQSISAIAAKLRNDTLSSVEITQLMLDRIEAEDGALNAYATVMAEEALAAAAAADRELKSGLDRGRLHGVPIAVKDLCYTAGTRTMGGLKVLEDFAPDFDATVVTKLKAAGSIILGKLNLTEGAMTGYHRDFKIPRNPHDHTLWSGASSSGSGVATAAGLAYGTLGSDTGGSIRFPAAACGIVGLKPTYGRVSRYGVLPLAESMDHIGPMTRTVADAALMLDAIAGHDRQDPTSLSDPHWPIYPALNELNGDLSGLKIGFDRRYTGEGVDPEVVAAVEDGMAKLGRLGAELVEIEMPFGDELMNGIAAWLPLLTSEAVLGHAAHYPAQRDRYGDYFRDLLDMGSGLSAIDYAKAHRERITLNGRIRTAMAPVDLLICPTMPTPPWPIDDELLYGPMGTRQPVRQKFTAPFDFNGYPTLTLPWGVNDANRPLSIQLVGKPLSEGLLCQVGHSLEQQG